MHFRAFVSFIVGLLISPAFCESEFIQPPAAGETRNFQDNPTYDVGENINIRWTTNLSSVGLILWQEYPSSSTSHSKSILSKSSALGISWTVSLDGFLTNVTKGESAIFYIALYESTAAAPDTTCHYFNITVPEAALTATTSIASATAAASFSAPASASASASASQSASSSGSTLSTGAVAGIAVGATIVGILVLGGLGFFAWKRLGKKDAGAGGYDKSMASPANGSPVSFAVHEKSGTIPVHEAPGPPVRHIYEAP